MYTAPMPPCPTNCCNVQVPNTVPINASAFIKSLPLWLVPFIYVSVYTDVRADADPWFVFRERIREPHLHGVSLVFFFLKSPTAVHVSQKTARWQWMSLQNMTKVMVMWCFFMCHHTAARLAGSKFPGLSVHKHNEVARKKHLLL